MNLIVSLSYSKPIDSVVTSTIKSKIFRWPARAFIIPSLTLFPASSAACVPRAGYALPHLGTGNRSRRYSRLPPRLLGAVHSYLLRESSPIILRLLCFLLVLPAMYLDDISGEFCLHFFLPIRLSVPVGPLVIFS